ncbi:Methyltransf_11 domain-containing protein [Psidium guajava]|nr:Methyltransf_11 domain-containing protein [Psidium guajava]
MTEVHRRRFNDETNFDQTISDANRLLLNSGLTYLKSNKIYRLKYSKWNPTQSRSPQIQSNNLDHNQSIQSQRSFLGCSEYLPWAPTELAIARFGWPSRDAAATEEGFDSRFPRDFNARMRCDRGQDSSRMQTPQKP